MTGAGKRILIVDEAFAAVRDGQIVVRSNGTEETIALGDYRTLTNEREVQFSNAKHSLYRDRPFTVGALARVTLNPAGLSGNGVRAMSRLGLTVPSDNPFDTSGGAADGIDALTKKLEMLARAYDPCLSCSVHLVQTRDGVHPPV